MEQKLIRFIIITTPPIDIQNKINELRKEICQIGNSFSSLSYPPHITLRTGVLVPENQIKLFFNLFENHISAQKSFMIHTQDITEGIYHDKGMVKHIFYYRIPLVSELMKLHQTLLTFHLYKKGPQNNYHPHLTLAFEDLTLQGFNRVKNNLSVKIKTAENYSWRLDNIGFYNQLEGNWRPFRIFKIKY